MPAFGAANAGAAKRARENREAADSSRPRIQPEENSRGLPQDLKKQFPVHSEVQLTGLAERKDYNGRSARIVEADNAEQRLIVLVDMGNQKTKKMRVHPENVTKSDGESDGPAKEASVGLSYDGQMNAAPNFSTMRTQDFRDQGKEPCGKCHLRMLSWQLSTRLWYEQGAVQYAVTGLIIINFILILIGNTYPLLGQSDLPTESIKIYKEFSEIVDMTFLVVFTVELVVNFFAHYFMDFWRDGWNVFDFIIIGGSWALMGTDIDASAIRIIRALRVTRLIGKMRSLRIIVNTLMLSLKSVGILFALLLLMMCIFSIMAITMIGSPMREAMFSPCQTLDGKAFTKCSSFPDTSQDERLKCAAQAKFIADTCSHHNALLRGCRAVNLSNDFHVAECSAMTSVAQCQANAGTCKKHKENNPDDAIDGKTCQERMMERVAEYGAAEPDISGFPNAAICAGEHTDELYKSDFGCGGDRRAGCGEWDPVNEDWITVKKEAGWKGVAAPQCVFVPLCNTWDNYVQSGIVGPDVKTACLATMRAATCIKDDAAVDPAPEAGWTKEECDKTVGAVFTKMNHASPGTSVALPKSWTYKTETEMDGVKGGGMCTWKENHSAAITIMEEWNGTGRFDNLGEALYSFFTIVTFEAWPDIVAPIHKKPWPVPQPYGTLFFVLYILASAFLLMNMFVTIFLDKMTEAKQYVKDQDNIRAALIKRRKEKLVAHIKKIKKVRREINSGEAADAGSAGSAKQLRSELHNIDAEYREDLPTIAELKEIKRQGDDEVYDRLLTVRSDDSVRDEIRKIKDGIRNSDDGEYEGAMGMMKDGQKADRAADGRGESLRKHGLSGGGGGGGGDRDASYWNDQDERHALQEFMKKTQEAMGSIVGRLDGLERGSAGKC